MDPAADFLWKPMSCGGPEVASFICELPVPSWAMGPKGCLLTELPSLTVLYIPEQLALELTSDCGLDGTKRIACRGNADREEILKQLTCAISSDDFDDKSTKLPISSYTASITTVSELSPEDSSLNSKTTKPWIWTSNTIDIDYGMPTRHRRETENTVSPASTKSTTDLSGHELHRKNKPTTEIPITNYDDVDATSVSPERDVTLDSSVSWKSDKSMELKTTAVSDLTTHEVNTQTEEQAEMSESTGVTMASKVLDSEVEETGEYLSAIGQGQLFSIIENGTMFDIIELNETTSDDLKLSKDIFMETPQSENEMLKTSTVKTNSNRNDNLYTTVVYHKEPPSVINFVTNKSVKKANKQWKKHVLKDKDPKKLNMQLQEKINLNNLENKRNDTILSKEVEMFPIMTDSLIKLNRTHRKGLPLTQYEANKALNEESTFRIPKFLNISTANEMNNNEHQHIEIKWHSEANGNITQTNLFITTKRSGVTKKNPTNFPEKQIELFNNADDSEEKFHKIDTKIDFLNINVTENNESETFIPKPEKIKIISDESMKEQLLPKSLVGEINTRFDTTSVASSSDDPLEPEPQVQPRPNRQRQLTRPQRRSFYPYFFSRVLG